MPSYCWGVRNQPHRILDRTDTHTIIEIDGEPKQIPNGAIRGRIDSGQRVRILSSGGGWKNGVVLESEACAPSFGGRLVVSFDSGGEREIFNARWMVAIDNKPPVIIDNQVESIITEVPMPKLDDALDGELTRALEIVGPLKEGDRVRIVLAGPPLEHLTGVLGTVETINSLGFVSVVVDGHGAKLFRREQLDLLVEGCRPVSVVTGIPVTVETIGVDARVKCLPGPKGDRWANKIGIVREIRGETAWLWFRDGVPLYPCGVERLVVV